MINLIKAFKITKTLEQIKSDMGYNETEKTNWYIAVVALQPSSNVEVLNDYYFKTEDEAIEYASNKIKEGHKLKSIRFDAQTAGVCSCVIHNYEGQFDVKYNSDFKYKLN